MNDPIEITVGNKNIGAENIQHLYYNVPEERYNAVKRILDFHPNIYSSLYFAEQEELRKDIADKLLKGYNAAPLRRFIANARDKAMEKFRDKTLQILVATDVAAGNLTLTIFLMLLSSSMKQKATPIEAGELQSRQKRGVNCNSFK